MNDHYTGLSFKDITYGWKVIRDYKDHTLDPKIVQRVLGNGRCKFDLFTTGPFFLDSRSEMGFLMMYDHEKDQET